MTIESKGKEIHKDGSGMQNIVVVHSLSLFPSLTGPCLGAEDNPAVKVEGASRNPGECSVHSCGQRTSALKQVHDTFPGAVVKRASELIVEDAQGK